MTETNSLRYKMKRVVLLRDLNPAMLMPDNIHSLSVEFVRSDIDDILTDVENSEEKKLYLWDEYGDLATAAFVSALCRFGYEVKKIDDYKYQEGDAVYAMFVDLDYHFFKVLIGSHEGN